MSLPGTAAWYRGGKLALPSLKQLAEVQPPKDEAEDSGPERCTSCGRERAAGEWSCPCGARPRWTRSSVLHGLSGEVAQPRAFAGLLGRIAGLPPGKVALIHGPPGTGKTTMALAALPGAGLVSAEMEPELIGAYIERLGLPRPAWIAIPRSRRLTNSERQQLQSASNWTCDLQAGHAPDMVVDSVTAACPDPVVALEAARDWARRYGGRVLAIAQTTYEGHARGSRELVHLADLFIELRPGPSWSVAVVSKNRFGGLAALPYLLGEKGAQVPEWDRYYTIEGKGPDYSIEPWPASSPWSEVWKEAESKKVKPPPPPAASAARRSILAPGGWAEPQDVEARRAFAERAGLPWWSPLEDE